MTCLILGRDMTQVRHTCQALADAWYILDGLWPLRTPYLLVFFTATGLEKAPPVEVCKLIEVLKKRFRHHWQVEGNC